MLIKVVKGNDPLGLSKYLLNPSKQAHPKDLPILATNMSGCSAEDLAHEFGFAHELNSRVSRTVCHFMVSLPPDEVANRIQMAEISKRLLAEMGHENCQYFVVEHHDRCDRNHVQHWHIATSAVDLKGCWVDDGFNYSRLAEVSRKLEIEFGLQRSQIRPARERQNLTTGEYRLKERRGKTLPKERLWQILEQSAIAAKTVPNFVEQLLQQGVSVQLRGLQTEQVQGISYSIDGVAFPGRKLGAAYSFIGLQKHLGLNYEPKRDIPQLKLLMSGQALPSQGKSQAEVWQAISDNLASAQVASDRLHERLKAVEQQKDADELPVRSQSPQAPTQPKPKETEWER